MSDPVTNADIEDVLSSIRRLVAQDGEQDGATPPPPVASGRLVLTPALRVMDTAPPEEVVSADAQDDDRPEVDASQDAPSDLPAPELVEGHELADLPHDDSAKRNLEARIAELEAVIADTSGQFHQQWEQDGEEGTDNAGGTVDSFSWEDFAAPQADIKINPDAEIEEARMAEFVEPEPDHSDGDTIAAMPFLRRGFNLPYEEQGSDADEPAEAPAEQPEPELDDPEPRSQLVSDTIPEQVAPDLDAMSDLDDTTDEPAYEGQDFVVDEEALRALVVQIVHQELQGALGERITRNVRNLVRREIRRALTSQELE